MAKRRERGMNKSAMCMCERKGDSSLYAGLRKAGKSQSDLHIIAIYHQCDPGFCKRFIHPSNFHLTSICTGF